MEIVQTAQTAVLLVLIAQMAYLIVVLRRALRAERQFQAALKQFQETQRRIAGTHRSS